MADIMNARIVLRLNANYMRIGWATVAEAFTALMGGDKTNPPALALDISYELDEDGKPKFDSFSSVVPTKWEDWLDLPIREWDSSINTVKRKIRVPSVIICPNYRDMPIKELRPTKQKIRERDGNRCQYTNQVLTNKTASVDHVHPKSLGGRDTWDNLVLCHKDINSKKGNKLNHEVGLKLLRQPIIPRPIPLCQLVTETKHPDHQHF